MLSDIILNKIKLNHQGKENAITRKELLFYCRQFKEDLTDRQLRNIYCRLPIVSGETGIFWPVRSEELDEFESYCKGKAFPLFERFRMVAKKHKKLTSERFTQWNLFL